MAQSAKRWSYKEVCIEIGISEPALLHYIEEEWIEPAFPQAEQMDEEDLARARLIRDLMEEMEVNESGVHLALHLIDQMNYLQSRVRQLSGNLDE